MKTKVLIIGSGPAGYTAGIYAGRAFLEPILVSGMEKGGQLTITTDVDNYPGFAETIQGPWLMQQMEEQCKRSGCKIVFDQISELNLEQRPFTAKGELGTEITFDSLIICTGAKAKWLGLDSEKKFLGFGVSACATCDGTFFKNKKVCVVGGGNTAVEEALYLSGICSHVLLIHRRDSLRAEKILQDRLFKTKNIEILWNSELKEVLGNSESKQVEGIRIFQNQTNQERSIDLEGVFIAIGHQPTTDLFRGKLEMDEEGYLICEAGSTKTSVKGIFAAGDVRDKQYRQAVTAAGLGCMAALDADKYLSTLEK